MAILPTTTTAPAVTTKKPEICYLVVGFLVMAATLGWFSILGHSFELSPTTISRRSVAIAAGETSHASRKLFSELSAAQHELEVERQQEIETTQPGISRRSAITAYTTAAAGLASTTMAGFGFPEIASGAPRNNGLVLTTAPASGLRWADAKVGSGETPEVGSITSVDYSMASTAGRFPSIYSTKNGDEPYRWRLGDGSTIRGIELAILGDPSEGIPPMKPGGIRRVIVPNNLGYNALIGRDNANNVILDKGNADYANLSPSSKNQRCLAGSEGSLGPIPPKEAADGAYQRWYQFYCNPRIPYQPDLVLDIKLYGKRGSAL
jgi:FKBP-type peptidyl-prolyl cis-trans isomerase